MQNRHGGGPFRTFHEPRNQEIGGDPMSIRKRRHPGSPSLMNFASSPHGYYSVEQDLRGGAISEINNTALPSQNSMQSSNTNTTNPSSNDLRPPMRPFVLIPTSVQAPDNMSSLDVITCQNAEMFQASAADVADHESSISGGMSVTVGQIGFRCIHCAKSPFAKAEFSSIFPAAVGSVAASLNVMTEVHFNKCTNIPQHIRIQIQDKNNRRCGEDEEAWNRAAFVEFCVDLCKRENVVNRTPAQTGLVLGPQGSSSEKSVTDQGSNSGGAFQGQNNSIVQPTPLPPKRMRLAEKEDSAISLPDAPGPYSSNTGDSASKQLADGSQSISQTRQSSDAGSGRPPLSRSPNTNSMYCFDNPGHMNYPFFQNQSGCWECRFCWGQMQRAPGYLWQSSQPPHQGFMEQHLNMCQHQSRFGNQGGGYNSSQQSSLMSSYIPEAPGQYGQQSNWNSASSQQQSYQQSPQRPPSPYSFRPQMSRSQQGGFQSHMQPTTPHPQDYSYQMQVHPFAQMYGDMGGQEHGSQMYDPIGKTNLGYGGGPQNDQGRAEDSEAALKAAVEHLSKAEKEREKENRDSVETGQLVLEEDKSLLTDYFYHVMKQLQICRFSEGDRKTRGGKRENIAIGYGGLQCVHCADSQNSRKFFWSNVDRLANSFAEIPSHVLKCRRCPVQTKYALQELKARHPEQMTALPRGSQKVFFRRMWRRLHDEDPGAKGNEPRTTEGNMSGDNSNTAVDIPLKDSELDLTSSIRGNFSEMSTENTAKALAAFASNPSESRSTRILLAIDEDKEWLSDMDCFIRKNLEVFCAEAKDVEAAQEDRKYPITEGQIGIRCIYCAMNPDVESRGSAVSFPYSIGGIYEAVREFQRLHLESCPCLPSTFSEKLNSLKGSSSLSSVLRRYYVQAAEALGMQDTSDGIRAGAKPKPIGGRSAKAEVEEEETCTNILDDSIRATEVENDAVVGPLSARKRKYSSENYD